MVSSPTSCPNSGHPTTQSASSKDSAFSSYADAQSQTFPSSGQDRYGLCLNWLTVLWKGQTLKKKTTKKNNSIRSDDDQVQSALVSDQVWGQEELP